jgi:hypothetical protein
MSKARLKECAGLQIQRVPWRAQHLMHDRRYRRWFSAIRSTALQAFIATFLAFAIQPGRSAAGAFALQQAFRDWRKRWLGFLMRVCCVHHNSQ